MPSRIDGRAPEQLRPVKLQRRFVQTPAGSCLITMGRTMVLCTASVVPGVPEWMEGKGRGWISAEYAMLPGSSHPRKPREGSRGRPDGRSQEIQRLVGRAFRTAVEMKNLGENTIWLDCDVLQADGGTRTAAITGAYVALHDAFKWMESKNMLFQWPLKTPVAGVSVGVVAGTPMLDLCYQEDSSADVDMTVVMTGQGQFIELAGTGERKGFDDAQLATLIGLARQGVAELHKIQEAALRG